MSKNKSNADRDLKEVTGQWLTPPAIAQKLGMDSHRVLDWIRTGKLAAVDLSDGTRPRYRVSPEALAAYLASRAVVPPPPPVRHDKRQLPIVKDYFRDVL